MATEATPSRDASVCLKRRFALNAATGWGNQVVTVLVGFVSLPYCILQLGEQSYGIYQLGASALVFFGILQLGMGPTLIRYYARAIAENDQKKIRQVSSTGLAMLGCLGILGAVLSLVSIPFFIHFYRIPQTLIWETTGLLVCLSLSLFLRMIMPAITGMLLGANRYDVSNSVMTFGQLLRFGLMIAFFELLHPSIFYFGLAILISQFVQVVLNFVFCLKLVGRSILFSFRQIHRATFRSMLNFSSLNLINSIAETTALQGPVLIIGKMFGEEMVTAFAPALVIAGAMRGFLAQIPRPLVPLASREIKNENRIENLGRLSLKIGTVVAFVGFGVAIPFCAFGHELLSFWLGTDLAWTWPVVAIMATVIAIANIQSTNYFLALGCGSIAPIVFSQIFEAAVVLVGTILGIVLFGWELLGIVVFIGLCYFVRGVLYLAYAYSRQFSYSYAGCLLQVYGKPALVGGVSVAFGLLVKNLFYPDNLVFLGMEIILTGLVYAVIGWMFVFPSDVKKAILNIIPKKGLV